MERAIFQSSLSPFLFHHTMGHGKQSHWIHIFEVNGFKRQT